MRWARSPSLVRRSRPVVSLSRRPAGTRPGTSGIRSATVLRPRSSFMVVKNACGLVQGEVDVGVRETDGAAIERDLVLRRHRRAEGGRLAVHRHAAREYRGFRLAARGCCAGTGEERLQAHYGVSPACLRRGGRRGQAFVHAGELFGGDERAEGREVVRGGAARGSQELVRDAEEGGRARGFVVRAYFGEEAAFQEVPYHGVGIHAAHAGDGAARQRAEVERAGQDLVGRVRERRRTGLLAEALHRAGATRIRR